MEEPDLQELGTRSVHGEWVAVNRTEDREIMGYLDPADSAYDLVVPRNRLGHALGEALPFEEAESFVLSHGIGELSGGWILDGEGPRLSISELSPDGIRLRDELLSKALLPSEEKRVAWPDKERRLTPAEDR